MLWGVLGPLTVHDGSGRLVTPTGPVRRVLLAALLSKVNQTVAADVLAEAVWGEVPPRSAAKTLQSHIVRLRDDLGRAEVVSVLRTDPAGYRLEVSPDDLDATRFALLTEIAHAEQERGDRTAALQSLDRALRLWRGEAYEEFADAAFPVTERVRLSELRAFALERRTDLALATGRAAELIPELEQRVAEAPYRERAWEQLVLALYRAGRQADALGAFRRARDVLAADLGVDPGPRLRELEGQVLRQDAVLLDEAPRPAERPVATVRDRVGECPYRGLIGYGDEDAELFVGRERLTAQLAGRLAEQPVVVVAGESGVGKSSLVHAGLLPALRAGALPGSAAWRCVVTGPGALAAAPSQGAELLVLDQAEELFSVLGKQDRGVAAAALQRLANAGTRVLLVLRADFFGRLAELPPLDRHAGAGTVLVGPMRDDELRRVVLEPAERTGLAVEPSMVDAVLDDVAGRPASLPMLSVALVRAWDNRNGTTLTLEGYRAGGGVSGALEAAAEECFLRLDHDGQAAARHLLVRLAAREGSSWVRRPLPRTGLDAAAGSGGQAALRALVDGRLVTVGLERVEVAHDALFERWPRLRGWLAERVRDAELVDHLAVATRSWAAGGRADGDLYRGSRLQAAREWHATHPGDLSPTEAEYLAASSAAADQELLAERARADREEAGRRRLARVVTALVAATAVAAGVGAFALVERSRAQRQALTADARRLAALALTAPDLRTSLLLAVASYRLQDTSDTRSALLGTLEREGSALFRIGTAARVQWIGASPDGTSVWVADNLHLVTRYDMRTRGVAATFPAGADHVGALSPDGRQMVVLGPASFFDRSGSARASVLDARSGKVLRVLPLLAAAGLDSASAAFTGDGRWLGVVDASGPDGSPGAGVAVLDATDLSRPARHLRLGSDVVALAAGLRCFAVVTAGGDVRVFRADSLATVDVGRRADLVTKGSGGLPLALDRDDRHLAVVMPAADHVPQVLDVGNLAAPGRPAEDVGATVTTLAFSPSGRLLAVGADNGAVTVFRTDGGLALRTAGGAGPVRGAAWAGSGRDDGLFTGGLDAQFVSWDLRESAHLVHRDGSPQAGVDTEIPATHALVGLSPPQGVGPESHEGLAVVDLRTGRRLVWPLGLRDDESVAQVSADGQDRTALLTVLLPDQTVRCELWSLDHGTRLSTFSPTTGSSRHQTFVAAMAPDGRSAVVSVGDRRLDRVALPSGRRLSSYGVRFAGAGADRALVMPWAFAPDGRVLVLGYDPGPPTGQGGTDHARADQRAALVDVRTGRVTAQVMLGPLGLLGPLSWSPDGSRLALGAADGRLWLLDGRTLQVVAGPVAAASGFVSSVAFSADGATVVSGGTDGTLALWDGHSLRPLGTPLHGASAGPWDVAFSPVDGDIVGLAPTSDPGDVQWFTLPARPRDWVRAACAVAGSPLSREEWRRYVGDRRYLRVC